MKLSALNTKSQDDFLAVISGPLEDELWLAERIITKRPFASVDSLITAFETVIEASTDDEKVILIASHPDLASKVAVLSASSQQEQASAGLTSLSPEEYAQFQQLNTAYRTKFGFPFVICARDHTKTSILKHFADRLQHTRSQEIDIGIAEVLKIIRLRLLDLIETSE